MKYIFGIICMLAIFGQDANAQNGLQFDGVNDCLTTNQPSISGAASRTLEAWVKIPSTVTTSQKVIMDMGATSPNGARFTLNLINGQNLRIEIAGNGFNGSTDISDNNWHHVAVTYNNTNAAGTKAKLYVDGILDAQADFTVAVNTAATNNLVIGKRMDNVNYFPGVMDEVRIWNIERTAAQILANKDHELCGQPAGLVGYYKLNEGIANGGNAGVDTASSTVAPFYIATLSGFALSGTASNWVTGAALASGGLTTSTISITSCGPYTSPGNNIYTTSGTYHDTIPGASGCDSAITINLTIGVAPVTAITAGAVTSTSATLSWNTVAGATGYQYVLDQNAGSPAGSGTGTTNVFYDASLLSPSTTYYMHVRAFCGSGYSVWYTQSFTTLCASPAITAFAGGFNCGPGSVALTANTLPGATLKWYAAAVGGSSIGSGNTFTTPSISATTDYYVEASTTAPLGQLGRNDYTGTAQAVPNNTGQGIRFNALADLNLDSAAVWVVSDTGTIMVQLQNTAGTVLYTDTFTFAGTGATSANRVKIYLPVDYSIPAGSNYKLLALAGTTVSLSREQAINPVFANYSISNVITMVSSWVNGANNSANYYYFYNLYVSGMGCTGPRTAVTATIKSKPAAMISPAGTVNICSGQTTLLSASGSDTTIYRWRNASGFLAGQDMPTFTTGVQGSYKVVAINTNGCTDTSVATQVVVQPAPTVNLGNDIVTCSASGTVMLDAANPGSTYVWDDNSAGQTRSVNAGGSYFVTVTSAFGCIGSDTIQVLINPSPMVDLGHDTVLCSGLTYTLDAQHPGASYQWDNNSTNPSRGVTATGNYWVKVTNGYNCAVTDTVAVTFLAQPVVDLGQAIQACEGNVFTLDAGNPACSFLWNNGSTAQTQVVSQAGTYFVTVSNAAQNCSGSDTVVVTLWPNPVVDLGNDTLICHNSTLMLNAGNPGAAYSWDNGAHTQSRSVALAGQYFVTVTTPHACTGSDTISVTVRDLPGGAINAVHGDTATYTFNVLDAERATAALWDFGDGSPAVSGGLTNLLSHRYLANGIYPVRVILKGECLDSVSLFATVDVYDVAATGIGSIAENHSILLYPNPANNSVTLESKSGLRFRQVVVYNTLGQTVYRANAGYDKRHVIDTRLLASGIYNIRIETDKGPIIRKLEVLK